MENDASRLLSGTPDLPPGCVALTFDDGPGPKSAELALMLRDEGVPGTFFVLGESVERHGDALDTIRDCGHVIGLHADRHRPFRSAQDAADEVGRCAERVSAYLAGPAWFRPPYGTGDWRVPGFAGPVGWHAHGRDWEIIYRHGQTVEACVDAIADQIIARNGGIVLLHDFISATEFVPARLTEADLDLRIVEITRLLIDRLRTAGLSFVGLPEPVPEPTPAVAVRGRAASRLLASDDLQSIRFNRANAKAAGGFLDSLMPVRAGDGPALFCMHPAVGLSWCYFALIPHVDARFPLYGLQARGVRRPEPLPVSMQEMARDYSDQIRTIQPSGPYYLLGWSLGGNVAFAVAQELERQGAQVGLLVTLGSNLAATGSSGAATPPWAICNLMLEQFGYVPALTAAEPDPQARMLDLVRRRPGQGLDEWPDQRVRALHRVISNNVAVARTHNVSTVHCPMLFFSASQESPDLAGSLEYWRSVVDGPIEAIELDCDRRHMLVSQHVARVGPAISAALTRAAAAAAGASV